MRESFALPDTAWSRTQCCITVHWRTTPCCTLQQSMGTERVQHCRIISPESGIRVIISICQSTVYQDFESPKIHQTCWHWITKKSQMILKKIEKSRIVEIQDLKVKRKNHEWLTETIESSFFFYSKSNFFFPRLKIRKTKYISSAHKTEHKKRL